MRDILAISLVLLVVALGVVSVAGARELPVVLSDVESHGAFFSDQGAAEGTSSDMRDSPLPVYDISIVEVRGIPEWITVPWLVPPMNQFSSGIAVVNIGLLRSLRASGIDVRVLALYDELKLYYLIEGSPLLSEGVVSGVGDVLWRSGVSYLISVDERFKDRLGVLRSEARLLRPFEASLASLAPVVSRPVPLPIYSWTDSFWIERMVNSVSEDDVFNYICSLSGEIPVNLSTGPHTIMTRYAYHPDCLKAAEYLYSQFDSMGVDVAYDRFFALLIRSVEFVGSEGYAVGNSGRIYHTQDSGDSWEKQLSGTDCHLWRTSFISPDTGWVAGMVGTLLKTTNGGSDWVALNAGVRGALYGVEFLDADVGWICGAGGVIRKTTDGGLTWTVQSSGSTRPLYDIDFVDPLNGWVVGSWGTILHSADGGETWCSQASRVEERLCDVCFVDSLNGWAVGGMGTIVHTGDGGTSWQRQGWQTNSFLSAVCFVDSLNGWAVGSHGVLLSTEDGGERWRVQQIGGNKNLKSVDFINSTQGWVGGAAVVLRTVDGGASWSSFGENMPDAWRNVVATLRGTKFPSQVYIVCAHYDSISDLPMVRAPGADDNASGTSLVVEAAKILKEHSFESTIKFICFSGEELGLYGSEHYAGSAFLGGEDIKAALNFDMIAYGTPGVFLIGNTPSSWLVDYCVTVRDSFVSDLIVSGMIDDRCSFSDHASFWDRGYCALTGIELDHFSNHFLHTRSDVVGKLSMDMAADVTRLAVASLASLAQLDTGPVALATVDIDPNTLNVRSNGQFITCYIELRPEESVASIDVSTIILNSSVEAEPERYALGDYDADEVPDLMVKFRRDRVQDVIQPGDAVEVVVSGKAGNSLFQGKDTIRVIGEKEHPVHASEAAFVVPETPDKYGLLRSYPNPFNPECRIRFDIPYAGMVSLEIFDAGGSILRTLVHGWREPGAYIEPWDGKAEDGRGLPSGVYFYRLEAGDFVATRKMVLLR